MLFKCLNFITNVITFGAYVLVLYGLVLLLGVIL